jgi:hypothetical protein
LERSFCPVLFYRNVGKIRLNWAGPAEAYCRFSSAAAGKNLPENLKKPVFFGGFSVFFLVFRGVFTIFLHRNQNGQICMEWPFLSKSQVFDRKKISSFFQ